MKKNITVNLFGSLYAINEDAYELLKRYEDNLRNYYRCQEGGEEIVADIEARIAELFDALKQDGVQAITIEHVESIIQRIGNLEQLHEDEPDMEAGPSDQEPASEEKTVRKRFFRDPEDKLLSGLMGGFARYFGGDPLLWRLGAILLFCISGGIILLAYVLLWILTPLALTSGERLQMQGKPVNPHNIGAEIMENMRRAEEYIRREETKSAARRFLELLSRIAAFGIKWMLFLLLGGAVFLFLVFIIRKYLQILLNSVYHVSGFSGLEWDGWWTFGSLYADYPLQVWIFICSILVLLAVPAYAAFHRYGRMKGNAAPMGIAACVIWAVVWLIAFAVAVNIGGWLSSRASDSNRKKYRTENLHNGIYIAPHEYKYMEREGWVVLKGERCNDRYIYSGQYYTGDREMHYLDTYNRHGRQEFRAEHRDTVASGLYRLTASVRANGQGAFVYLRADSALKTYWAEIPDMGSEGGNIWEEARKKLEADPDASWSVRQIAEANDGRGFGWNRVVLDSVEVRGSVVRYGVSTDPSFTNHTWQGQWFSACDFALSRIGDLPQAAKK